MIVLDAPTNAFEGVQAFGPFVQRLLTAALQKRLYVIELTGNVLEISEPRRKS